MSTVLARKIENGVVAYEIYQTLLIIVSKLSYDYRTSRALEIESFHLHFCQARYFIIGFNAHTSATKYIKRF